MADDKKTVNLFINTKGASASIKELQKDYRTLFNEVAKLDPESKEFIDKSKDLKKVSDRLDEVKKAARGVSDEVKQSTGFFSNFKSVFLGAFSADAVMRAGEAVIGFIKDSIQVSMEYKKSLSELSSITGAAGADLQYLSDAAKETAKQHGVLAKDVVDTYKAIGSAKPELLSNKEALAAITEEAITLAHASGMELPAAAKSLTDALNQFSAPASEANRYINALAAGSKEGAAEIPEITEALLKFGVAADSANISIEESTALIETLAEKGIKGAEAGTGLRNVLAKLSAPDTLPKEALESLKAAGVEIYKLSDTTIPFIDRLNELGKIQGNTAAITRVFGLENKNAAQVLLENRGTFERLTKAVTGTNVATEQAAINMDNLAGDTEKFFAVVDAEMLDSGNSIDSLLRSVVQFGTEVLKNISPLKEVFSSIGTTVETVWDSFMKLISALLPFNSSADGTKTVIQLIATALNTVLIPLKGFTAAVTVAYDALRILLNAGKEVANFFGAEFKLDPEANFDTLGNNLKKHADETIGSFKNIWKENEKTVEKSLDQIDKEIDNKFKEMNSAMQNSLQNSFTIKPKIDTSESDKQKEELRKQWEKTFFNFEPPKEKTAEELAAEKKAYEEREKLLKKQEDDRKKAQEQAKKDAIDADRNIRKLQESLLTDTLQNKIKRLQMQAEDEINLLKGTEEQKAQQTILIAQKLANDIDKLKADEIKKQEESDKKAQLEKEKSDKEFLDKKYRAEVAANEMGIILAKNDQDKILELKLKRLEIERQRELENEELTNEEIKLIKEQYRQKEKDLDEQARSEKRQKDVDNASETLSYLSQGITAIMDFSKIKTDRELNGIQEEKNARISQLDSELAARKITQEQYNREKKKAEEKAAKETAVIKTKQAERDKIASIAQATIATALAVVSNLKYGPFAAAAAGVLGAISIAKIIATPIPKFAKGGSTARAMRSLGGLGYGNTSMPTVSNGGYVDQPLIAEFGEEGPEYVVPNWMLRDNRIADMVSVMEAIRSGGMRGFAVGGPTLPGDVVSGGSSSDVTTSDNVVFELMLQELRLTREAIQRIPTNIKASVSLDEINDKNKLMDEIKSEGNL